MAGFKYEKNGKFVGTPKGHKKAGWAKPGTPMLPPYRPLLMRGGSGK